VTESQSGGSYEEGIAAAERGDFGAAVHLWRFAAEQDHAKAHYNLGVAYARGIGVPKNISEAIKWWRTARDLGHEAAIERLGEIEADGEGGHDLSFHDDLLELVDPLTSRNQYAHWLAIVKKGPLTDDDPRIERLERARTRLGAVGVERWWSDRVKAIEEAASRKASTNLFAGVVIGFWLGALVLLFANNHR